MLKKFLLALSVPAVIFGSELSDKVTEVYNYLTNNKGFVVEQNAIRRFTSPDTNYSFPLLVEESTQNNSAGLAYMLAAIDTVQNSGKKSAVENNFGKYIVVGSGTNPDSVFNALRGQVTAVNGDGKKCVGGAFASFQNPIKSMARLDYRVDVPSYVKINIYSHNGRLVKSFDEKMKVKGTYSLSLDFNGLPAGNYVAEMNLGEQSICKVITRMK